MTESHAEAPGQERTAEDAVKDASSNVVTDTAPVSEPQHSADKGVEGAIRSVQKAQDEADSKGHFGERVDPRPLEDYSVAGSIARAKAGDSGSLPQQ